MITNNHLLWRLAKIFLYGMFDRAELEACKALAGLRGHWYMWNAQENEVKVKRVNMSSCKATQ